MAATPYYIKPEVLYHFTSPFHLSSILNTGHIALTESNLNTIEGNCVVVWLTDSPQPDCHGLLFDPSMPEELDKTRIRITVHYKPHFKRWSEWSDKKGISQEWKEALISTASAEETYKTWYVSERTIPMTEVLKIENTATGEIISKESVVSVYEHAALRFSNPIDEYIANQPENIQVLLLQVRETIRAAAPDATEKISWQMPTFWQGRNLIHFAAQKSHLGIYPGAEAMKHFAPRLAEYMTSKGAIQFPYKSFGAEQMKLISEIAAWTATVCQCGKENAKT